jgi:hypothetical protein
MGDEKKGRGKGEELKGIKAMRASNVVATPASP